MNEPPLPPPALSQSALDARSRRRFAIIAGMRFLGVAVLMLGIALMLERIPRLTGDVARYAGLLVALVGAFDFIIVPRLLARAWATPRDKP